MYIFKYLNGFFIFRYFLHLLIENNIDLLKIEKDLVDCCEGGLEFLIGPRIAYGKSMRTEDHHSKESNKESIMRNQSVTNGLHISRREYSFSRKNIQNIKNNIDEL